VNDLRPQFSGDEPASVNMRITCLETAFIELLDRVAELERMLRFEISQREALETYLLPISGLPRRVDRLESEARARRKTRDPDHSQRRATT